MNKPCFSCSGKAAIGRSYTHMLLRAGDGGEMELFPKTIPAVYYLCDACDEISKDPKSAVAVSIKKSCESHLSTMLDYAPPELACNRDA